MGLKTWSPGDVLSADDLMKYAENAWGGFSLTTDSDGRATVTHGAGFTPGAVIAICQTPNGGTDYGGIHAVYNLTATTFDFRMFTIAGSVATLAVTGFFICFP